MGKIKDQMMNDFKSSPLTKGDIVLVNDSIIYKNMSYPIKNKQLMCKYVSSEVDKIIVMYDNKKYEVSRGDINRYEDNIGVNPLPAKSWMDGMTKCGYTISWVYWNKGITMVFNGKEIRGFNFDSYIIDNNGEKIHYQRDFCWTLEQKQDFIESLYNELNCGVIIVKYNDDDKMLECGCEYDVIDGKQRLNTLIEFFNDDFPDRNGYYWSDFSKIAQRRFHGITCMDFFEIQMKTPDSNIKKIFLNANYTGVPMSKEHLEFVKSINI